MYHNVLDKNILSAHPKASQGYFKSKVYIYALQINRMIEIYICLKRQQPQS